MSLNFLKIIVAGIWRWFKQLIMLPDNLAKVADINKCLETQKRLNETEQQLARDAAIKAGQMFFSNNVYWSKNENSQIEESPYCPRCFENDGKFIHLTVAYGGNAAACPQCKTKVIITGKPK
jgi:formylmethanofuran dehydrogenase subunit E